MTLTTTSTTPSGNPTMELSDKGLLRGSIGLAVLSIVCFGFLYSLAGVGLGQVFFPDTANGSLIKRDGKVVGSSLVAQPFADDRYFSSRPSAVGHQPMAAGGSNQARTNPDMRKRLEKEVAAVALREGVDPSRVPGEMVTQSGSGFDPHISPQGAEIQLKRVAGARGLSPDAVTNLITQHTQAEQLGLLGQARVNVLELNLALDAFSTDSKSAGPAEKQ